MVLTGHLNASCETHVCPSREARWQASQSQRAVLCEMRSQVEVGRKGWRALRAASAPGFCLLLWPRITGWKCPRRRFCPGIFMSTTAVITHTSLPPSALLQDSKLKIWQWFTIIFRLPDLDQGLCQKLVTLGWMRPSLCSRGKHTH